jgi:hypothetical protein
MNGKLRFPVTAPEISTSNFYNLAHFFAARRTFFRGGGDTSTKITNAPDREFSHDHDPWKRFLAAAGRA